MVIPLLPPAFTMITACPSPSPVLCRMQARERQAGGFLETQHAVHGLSAVASPPLAQVIEGAHPHHATAMRIGLETDIAEVRATENFGLRITIDSLPLLDDTHERLVLVCVPIHAP